MWIALSLGLLASPFPSQEPPRRQESPAEQAEREARLEALENELAFHYRDHGVPELFLALRRHARRMAQVPQDDPEAPLLLAEQAWLKGQLALRGPQELLPRLAHRALPDRSEQEFLALYGKADADTLALTAYELGLQRTAEAERAIEAAFVAGDYTSSIEPEGAPPMLF